MKRAMPVVHAALLDKARKLVKYQGILLMNSSHFQIIVLAVVLVIALISLTLMYVLGIQPPDVILIVVGGAAAALFSEVAQDNALNRADRVIKNSTVEVREAAPSA